LSTCRACHRGRTLQRKTSHDGHTRDARAWSVATAEALSNPCKRTISSRTSAEQPLIYTFLITPEIRLEALMNLIFLHWPHPIEKIPPVITHAVGAPHQPWNRHQRALKMPPASGGLSTGGSLIIQQRHSVASTIHFLSGTQKREERDRDETGSDEDWGCLHRQLAKERREKKLRKKFKLVLCRFNKDIFFPRIFLYLFPFFFLHLLPVLYLYIPNFNKKAPPVNGPSSPNCSFL